MKAIIGWAYVIIYFIAAPIVFMLELFKVYTRTQFCIDLVFFGTKDVLKAVINAQSALETGNQTSSIFQKYNNCFGMRPATKDCFYQGKRNTSNGEFAFYINLAASVYDYRLYLTYRAFDADGNNMMAYLHGILQNLKDVRIGISSFVNALFIAGFFEGISPEEYYNRMFLKFTSWKSYWFYIAIVIGVIYSSLIGWLIAKICRRKKKK